MLLNPNNVFIVPKENLATKTALCLRFAVWNAQSVNGKSGSICDFVISNRLDLLALSETWLSRMEEENITIAEITGNLQDYDFFHLPRSGRGGGMGLLLRKGFTSKLNEVIPSCRYLQNLPLQEKQTDSIHVFRRLLCLVRGFSSFLGTLLSLLEI